MPPNSTSNHVLFLEIFLQDAFTYRLIHAETYAYLQNSEKCFTLKIISQLADSATYLCIATSPSGTADKSFDVTVNLPPSIDDVVENVIAVVGDNVTLTCRSNAVPPPVMSWYRKAVSVSTSLPLNFEMKLIIESWKRH